MTAGALADEIGASPAAASFHLKELDRAGLIYATRSGRYVRYAIRFEGMRQLLGYLTDECCQGQPELCGYGARRKTSSKSRKGAKNAC